MSTLEKRPYFTRTRLIQFAVGMVVGGLAGYGVGQLAAEIRLADDWRWSDALGMIVACLLFTLGAVMLVASFNRRAIGAMLDPGDPRPAGPPQVRLARQQGWVLALGGAMMAAPILAASLGLPYGLRAAALAGLIALFIVQTVFNLAFWQSADEVMRRMVGEVSLICFWVLQGALFLWAAGEKLGLAPALSTWDCLTVLMIFYLAVSAVIGFRRGFA
ncbi:MAG: hypothetical protein IT546_12465 [Caulobacteraceae bacterium]|nr:hypothetical protein [Caulobacteraceae bacterium]